MKALWILLISAISSTAHAKKVSVDWKEMKRATQYEIKIEKESKVVLTKKLQDPHWRGDLNFGLYQYQIRAYDRLKRPGQWSQPMSLVVMPASPKPVYPDEDAKVTLYGADSKIDFSWEAVSGVNSYRVTVLNGGKKVEEKTVSGNHAKIGNLNPGAYSWKVAVVFEKGDKKWDGPESDPIRLTLKREKLKVPEPIEPLGLIRARHNKTYTVKWKSVEGAQSYQVRMIPVKTRGPASVSAAEQVISVKDTETEVQLPADGNYTWEVQAVTDNVKSGTAVANFNIVKTQDFREGRGVVELSGLFATFTLDEVSPAAGIKGSSAQTESSGYRILGTYFPWENWGGGLAFTSHELRLNQQKYNITNLELTARYRTQFGDAYSPYYLYPKLGVEARQYIMLLPQAGTMTSSNEWGSQLEKYQLSTLGPQIGFDIRKQFSRAWGASFQAQYYYPLALIGSDNGVNGLKTGGQSAKNLSIGAQGQYWFNDKLAMGAGIYFENRAVSFSRYESIPAVTSGEPESVSMSAKYLMMSLTYSLGD